MPIESRQTKRKPSWVTTLKKRNSGAKSGVESPDGVKADGSQCANEVMPTVDAMMSSVAATAADIMVDTANGNVAHGDDDNNLTQQIMIRCPFVSNAGSELPSCRSATDYGALDADDDATEQPICTRRVLTKSQLRGK